MARTKRFAVIIFIVTLMLMLVSGICGCGSVEQEKTEQKEIHVSASGSDETGEGTKDAPYATAAAAAKESPGSVIFIHGGDYGPIRLGPECSGSEKAPTIIQAAAGEKAVIFEDGEYDLCAGGIYVDGGQNIEIYNNYVSNCDIGLEVATEHSPDENELFKVSGIHVHDNVIADCTGYAGICFGGYDNDLGFTEGCVLEHNTLVDNSVQIGVQRSKNNRINSNLIIGGEIAVEFNDDLRSEDMINDISGNAFCDTDDEENLTDAFGTVYQDRTKVIDGFRSLIDGVGSRVVPDEGSS